MTKLYAEVYKLKAGAEHAAHVAGMYGQAEAVAIWRAKVTSYGNVLGMLGNPEITPTRWKRLVCRIFHQRNSIECASCGGQL